MKVGIYARKSRLTDKGDSMGMQEETCRAYLQLHYPDQLEQIVCYKDEGFSGGNIERPDYKRMMTDIIANKLDMLICYRLDRISRNVADFSNMYRILEKHHITFVSVKEQFDTSTPMGRCMLSITLAFSQMERETIAERIRDNLLALSEKGQWLGGTTPLGYSSRQVQFMASTGKLKNGYELVQIPEEVPLVTLIFVMYLKLGSLTQLEHYLRSHHYCTRTQHAFSTNVLRDMLRNPTYCGASETVYDYLKELGYQVKFDKTQCDEMLALMSFNKRDHQGHSHPVTDWIIALGTHSPIISSETWLAVQKQLQHNSRLDFGHNQAAHNSSLALLSTLLYCGQCGAPMKVTNQSILKDGTNSYIYRCANKLKSKGQLCHLPNAKGHYLDPSILEAFMSFAPTQKEWQAALSLSLHQLAKQKQTCPLPKTPPISKQYEGNAHKIQNLLELSAITSSQETRRLLLAEIEALQERNALLQEKLPASLATPKVLSSEQLQTLCNLLRSPSCLLEQASFAQKRALLQQLIDHIDWYPDHVVLFLANLNRNLDKER